MNTDDRVMVLHSALSLIAIYQYIKFNLFVFNDQDKFIIAKIRKDNSSVITCDRVTAPALCIFSDGRPLIYKLSVNSIL